MKLRTIPFKENFRVIKYQQVDKNNLVNYSICQVWQDRQSKYAFALILRSKFCSCAVLDPKNLSEYVTNYQVTSFPLPTNRLKTCFFLAYHCLSNKLKIPLHYQVTSLKFRLKISLFLAFYTQHHKCKG